MVHGRQITSHISARTEGLAAWEFEALEARFVYLLRAHGVSRRAAIAHNGLMRNSELGDKGVVSFDDVDVVRL